MPSYALARLNSVKVLRKVWYGVVVGGLRSACSGPGFRFRRLPRMEEPKNFRRRLQIASRQPVPAQQLGSLQVQVLLTAISEEECACLLARSVGRVCTKRSIGTAWHSRRSIVAPRTAFY